MPMAAPNKLHTIHELLECKYRCRQCSEHFILSPLASSKDSSHWGLGEEVHQVESKEDNSFPAQTKNNTDW